MKVTLTLNVKQLQVIARSLNVAYFKDLCYDKDDPDTQELRNVIDKAVGEAAKEWPGDAKAKVSASW